MEIADKLFIIEATQASSKYFYNIDKVDQWEIQEIMRHIK